MVKRRGNSFGVRVWDPASRTHIWVGSFRISDYGSVREAENAARAAELKAKEEIGPTGLRGGPTCAQFANRWPVAYNTGGTRWGKKTVGDYRNAVRGFAETFGDLPLRKFTITHARPFAETISPRYVAVLRAMFADAYTDGMVPANPFLRLRMPTSPGRKNIMVLTESELEQLIDVAEAEAGPTIAAMIAMAGYTGIRPGELYALRAQDPDPANLEVSIYVNHNGVEYKRPKNREARPRIILPPQVIRRLNDVPRQLKGRWCPGCEGQGKADCIVCEGEGRVRWLFVGARGEHFRKSTFERYWRTARAVFEAQLAPGRAAALRTARGGKNMVLYELRHTAATLLLARLEGVGDKYELVAWQLGHKDRGRLVRERYGHPDEERTRERIKAAFGTVQPIGRSREQGEAESA